MRAEKVQMLNVVKELLQDKPVFIIGFNALTVAEFSEFRAKLAALGAEVHVVKNTMITKAAEALGYEALAAQKLSLLLDGSGGGGRCGGGNRDRRGGADTQALLKSLDQLGKVQDSQTLDVAHKLLHFSSQLDLFISHCSRFLFFKRLALSSARKHLRRKQHSTTSH